MFTRYYRRPKAKSRRNCAYRKSRGACTYASLLQCSRSSGITVEASQAAISDASRAHCERKNPVCAESGFLRYKNWWERKEAEVFVDNHVLTGIPVFTAPDSLRVVSGECSCFVPLEQVACIRLSD